MPAFKVAKDICDKLSWRDVFKGLGAGHFDTGTFVRNLLTYNNPKANVADRNAAADKLNSMIPNIQNLTDEQKEVIKDFLKGLPGSDDDEVKKIKDVCCK